MFILQDGGLYSFKEKRHHELFEHLLTDRLYNPQWINQAQKIHLLVILQAIRLLTRDKTILVIIQNLIRIFKFSLFSLERS